MNTAQVEFYGFIMERVAETNQPKAQELLSESFAKQKDGTFNQDYMMSFIPRMMTLIKPECVEEVKAIMMNHKA